jgi:hypothetical protein
MTTDDFVRNCKIEKDRLLETYLSGSSAVSGSCVTEVGDHIRSLRLSAEQSDTLRKLLDLALTDVFYTILLGLDGCARIGDMEQQSFLIESEDGSLVGHGDG